LTKNILKETYDFQTQCAQKCLQDVFCSGFNFRTRKGQLKKPNCQLTHKLHHEFHVCSTDDKGWIFYHSVKPLKVNNKRLLSESEVCTGKYFPEFFVQTERRWSEVCADKSKANTFPHWPSKTRLINRLLYGALNTFSDCIFELCFICYSFPLRLDLVSSPNIVYGKECLTIALELLFR
jgi:hypothetical protein